ncbi:MAG TPA: hypothetical protein DDY77_07010 [Clostridiales bacterium]|nr:hypothetical protein [Clostridiales bacterium]
MKPSRVVAYSAVTTALATVFLIIGEFFPVLSLSAAFMASLTIMIPLAKRTYLGAILSYLASAILALLLTGFKFEAVLPFAAFCGLHPIVNRFVEDKKINKILAVIVKDVWFVGACLLTFFLTDFTIGGNEFVEKHIVPIIIIGGAVFFVAYDYLFGLFQKKTDEIISRLKL